MKEKAYYAVEFDPRSGHVYYVNLRTQEMSWEKPKLLQHLHVELKPPDEYYEMVDVNGFPYWYNPRIDDMTYKKPLS